MNTVEDTYYLSLSSQLQQPPSTSLKLHMEAQLPLDDHFHGRVHRILYQGYHALEPLIILNSDIFRGRICDGMELSCSYENKYLRPKDNADIIQEIHLDEDDDIFKHKDIIMKVQ